MTEQYEKLAAVYDSFMYDVSYAEWAEYISRMMTGVAVLEYACGTGGLTLELCARGFDVLGVDISEDMLDVAAQKLRKNAYDVKLACADMTDFTLNKQAGCAVCACDGVNYITEREALERFFRNVYKNIAAGGAFLFDISSAYKLREVLADEFFYDDSDEGTLFWQNDFDAQSGLLTMDISLFVPRGDVHIRYDERHVQRAWTEEEIKAALKKAGFKDIKAFGFMTEEGPEADCERIQFSAVKGEKV